MSNDDKSHRIPKAWMNDEGFISPSYGCGYIIPLYTHPAPSSATQPLERAAKLCEERAATWNREAENYSNGSPGQQEYLSRAAEAGSLALAIREIPWRDTPEGKNYGRSDGKADSNG